MALTIQAIAQQAPLVGRITDEAGKPVRGASIHLDGSKHNTTAMADSLGLFTTEIMPEGRYRAWIAVDRMDGTTGKARVLKAGYVHVSSTDEDRYYYFTLNGSPKAVVANNAINPYMAAHMHQVESSDRRFDMPVRRRHKRDISYEQDVWRVEREDTEPAEKGR